MSSWTNVTVTGVSEEKLDEVFSRVKESSISEYGVKYVLRDGMYDDLEDKPCMVQVRSWRSHKPRAVLSWFLEEDGSYTIPDKILLTTTNDTSRSAGVKVYDLSKADPINWGGSDHKRVHEDPRELSTDCYTLLHEDSDSCVMEHYSEKRPQHLLDTVEEKFGINGVM
jgi:hypothetical protein